MNESRNWLASARKRLLASQSFYLLAIIVVMCVITGAFNPNFFSISNLRSVMGQISTLGLVATGATILIVSGHFDISIGSIIGFAATMMCMTINAGGSDIVAMLVAIGVALLCSAFNGVMSVIFRAPSFIITLATANVFKGLALTISDGGNEYVFGRVEYFAGTYILDFIPLLFLISLAGYFIIAAMMRQTQFGRRVFAIGSNAQAAYLAGIRVNANKIKFFMVNGLIVGIAVIMFVSRLGAAQSTTGSGMELDAIGAVIIGGAPITGGKGNLLGTFCGVLLTGLIYNMLNLLRVSPYLQTISIGLLILLSIAISSLRLRVAK